MRTSSGLALPALLRLVTGLFFILSGIQGITAYDSPGNELQRTFTRLVGGSTSSVDILFAVLLLVAGVVLIGFLFVRGGSAVYVIGSVVVAGVWIAWIVYVHFLKGQAFQPEVLGWSRLFLRDLVILIALPIAMS